MFVCLGFVVIDLSFHNFKLIETIVLLSYHYWFYIFPLRSAELMQEILEVPSAETILIQINREMEHICKHIMGNGSLCPYPKKLMSEEEHLKARKPGTTLCIPQLQRDALLRLPLDFPAKKFWTQITSELSTDWQG